MKIHPRDTRGEVCSMLMSLVSENPNSSFGNIRGGLTFVEVFIMHVQHMKEEIHEICASPQDNVTSVDTSSTLLHYLVFCSK